MPLERRTSLSRARRRAEGTVGDRSAGGDSAAPERAKRSSRAPVAHATVARRPWSGKGRPGAAGSRQTWQTAGGPLAAEQCSACPTRGSETSTPAVQVPEPGARAQLARAMTRAAAAAAARCEASVSWPNTPSMIGSIVPLCGPGRALRCPQSVGPCTWSTCGSVWPTWALSERGQLQMTLHHGDDPRRPACPSCLLNGASPREA